MGAKPKIDWQHAFDEYLTVYKPKGMRQKEFAKLKGVQPQWLSTQFTEIRRERTLQSVKSEMPKVMLKALRNVKEALDEEPDRSPSAVRKGISVEGKAKISIEAFKAMADREGMSPQAVTLNVQQNNMNKTLIALPTMFSDNGNVSELKSLLQGEQKPDDSIQ